MTSKKTVSPVWAAIICIFLLSTIFFGFVLMGLPLQTIFFVSLVFISLVAKINHFTLKEIEDMIVEGGRKSSLLVFILMAVGCVVGSWLISGVVPSIIYYGLKILTPPTFLVMGLFICALVSIFTGSSYTSIGTMGVAFMGIGYGLGINPALTAGMVVSGAIFGDKMSPFSDTTILASATSGINVYRHIGSMLYTTVPALLISAILYAFFGLNHGNHTLDTSKISTINQALSDNFHISPFLMLIPIIVVIMAIKKFPPVPSLAIGALAGVICALVFQSDKYSLEQILKTLTNGCSITTGVAEVDTLLNRGGILNMLSTASMAIMAMAFGEMLQQLGVLEVLTPKLKKLARTPRRLVLCTLVTALLGGMITATQILSIILTGEIFKDVYDEVGVQRRVMSRTLEDGGTIFPFLIPWAAPALYAYGILDVTSAEYGPYCFLAILCPSIAIFYALTGIAVFKCTPESDQIEKAQ